MGQYFGINIAWVVVGTLALVGAIAFKRKREVRKREAEQQQNRGEMKDAQ
jgi:hypothetical protein